MRPADRGALAALALALGALPLLLPPFWLFLCTSAVIAAFAALSVGIVTGRAGMVALAPLAFAAIGAWAVTWLNLETGLPFLAQLALGALAAVPFGVAIGLPALRLRGVNLAVVTLGFAAAVDIVLATGSFPGSATGEAVARPGWLLAEWRYFTFCWLAFVLVAAALAWVGARRAGSAWLAVRHSERATAAMGLSVPRTKLSAFAAGAFVAGLGGGLLAGLLGLLSETNFEPVVSLVTFALAVMMGAQLAAGAVLAGAASVFVPEALRRMGVAADMANVLFGLGAIHALSTARGGIAGDVARRRARRRPRPGAPETPARATRPAAAQRPGTARPGPAAGPALEVRGLAVRYGSVVALDGVDLVVRRGAVAALIGANGAGKSTLVDAVAGFTRYAGSVLLDGAPLDGVPAHRRARAGLRRTFQHERTVPELSVGRYVRLAAGRRMDDGELEDLLGFLDCPPAGRPLETVDVGTRRLVELAGALAARPRVLLLDEPGAGLAGAESLRLAGRIREVPARFGCAVLVIEHDMEVVRAACAEVTVLDFGRVIAAGPVDEVLGRRDVVAAYLGEEVRA